MGPTLSYSQSQVLSACQGFRPVAPLFWLFFLMQKGVWLYRHAYDASLLTLILNIYIYIYIWDCGSNFKCSFVNRG